MAHIKTVEIKSLFGEHDLVWNLNPDVNVLGGHNGSGKTTILDCMANLLLTGDLNGRLVQLIRRIDVTLDNDKQISLKREPKDREEREKEGDDKKQTVDYQAPWGNLSEEDRKNLTIGIVSTFDKKMVSPKDFPRGSVLPSFLDVAIERLQLEYVKFQNTLLRKMYELAKEKGEGAKKDAIGRIKAKHELFFETLDSLLFETGKKVKRKESEISFLKDGKIEITADKLSAGEKQMLIILLIALIQDERKSIIFMDEPEISLHSDWQRELISHVRALNPNAQIIIATHSPAVIMNGWLDKVFNVQDLYVK
jgi:predicted ATPase